MKKLTWYKVKCSDYLGYFSNDGEFKIKKFKYEIELWKAHRSDKNHFINFISKYPTLSRAKRVAEMINRG